MGSWPEAPTGSASIHANDGKPEGVHGLELLTARKEVIGWARPAICAVSDPHDRFAGIKGQGALSHYQTVGPDVLQQPPRALPAQE